MSRRRTPAHLMAERYGPSLWWETPAPDPTGDLGQLLTDEETWGRCLGCSRLVLLDHPCPHCQAIRKAAS